MTRYAVEYSETEARQTASPPVPQNDNRRGEIAPTYERPRWEIRFRIPSILKTAAVFMSGAAVLFVSEAYAPEKYRISTLMGTYDARIAAAVKAAELQQQTQIEQYTAQLKLAADQQAEQYRAITRSVLDNYTATYEINKVKTQALMDMQGRLTSVLVGQKTQEQGIDIAIINLARGFMCAAVAGTRGGRTRCRGADTEWQAGCRRLRARSARW